LGPTLIGKSAKGRYVELEELNEVPQSETGTTLKLSRIIDVLFHPISIPGLIMLAFYLGIPVLFKALSQKLRSLDYFAQSFLVEIISWYVYAIMVLFLFWYVGFCVRKSALSRNRLPEPYSTGWNNDFYSTFCQTMRITLCFIIFWGPFFVFCWITWCLVITSPFYSEAAIPVLISSSITLVFLAFAITFFPMSLLATVMFESLEGLNPKFVIGSIVSTFFRYFGLLFMYCVLYGIPIAAYEIIRLQIPKEHIQTAHLIMKGWFIYLLFISAHLLGVFFRRNEEKLYWDV
jgi:hypothetical protein